MKKYFKFFLISLIIFAVLIFVCCPKDKFNENRVVLELYIQNVRGAKMKFDETGTIHYIGNNKCYYVGLDKNRNLYIRHGDGIAFSEYFTRVNEDNSKKGFIMDIAI